MAEPAAEKFIAIAKGETQQAKKGVYGDSNKESANIETNTGSRGGNGFITIDGQEQVDPALFKITDEEREMALVIKEAIEDTPDIDNLNDFMYVNLAIAGEGDVGWAVDRAYKMQGVRQEYKVALTLEEGKHALKRMTELTPGWMMSFTFNPYSGKCVQVADFAVSLDNNTKSLQIQDEIGRGAHYMCYANFPSFESIRMGNTHIFECMGYDWTNASVDLNRFAKVTNVTHDAFPSNVKTLWYHTPSMALVIYSMVKKLVSEDVSSKWQVGCQFRGGRLDNFYLQPTPEAAAERLLENFYAALRLRLESERTFRLTPDDDDVDDDYIDEDDN